MERRGRLATSGALLIFSLALVGLAGREAYREALPYFVAGPSFDSRFAALASGKLTPANSIWSQNMYLNDCLDVLDSLFARVQPTSNQHAFFSQCRDAALTLTAQSPTYGEAWIVVAATSVALGDFERFRQALRAAHLAAPSVHWQADRRQTLAARHLDQIDGHGLADLDSDFRTLLNSGTGTAALAARYSVTPELRERITATVETAPPDLQRRFLAAVKAEGIK